MTVAQTILAQLGGNRFAAMTGAKSFCAGENTLTFKIGRNASKATAVRVTLDPDDTYMMEFLAIRNFEVTTVASFDGVYCDLLAPTFEDATGLATSL